MITRMWEVRAEPERVDALLDWVWEALAAVESAEGHSGTQVYRSRDRIVVITSWRDQPQELPEPPAALVARPAHAWDFTPVPRP